MSEVVHFIGGPLSHQVRSIPDGFGDLYHLHTLAPKPNWLWGATGGSTHVEVKKELYRRKTLFIYEGEE